VYSLCLRMIKNPAEAEELTQQVFMQLFRKISTFRGESGFPTWLHRVAVNSVLMHLCQKKPTDLLVEGSVVLGEYFSRGRSKTWEVRNARAGPWDLWWAWVDLNHRPRPYQY
jgi:RNA polymerase sigma factor (sigma-70 family)